MYYWFSGQGFEQYGWKLIYVFQIKLDFTG